jgi:nitrogen regulatory protein P-II 2
MKYIIAIIKPHKLEDVRAALSAIGISGLTASEAKGFGRQKGQTEIYRGAEYATNLLPKVKVEIAIPDSMLGQAVDTIRQAANTDTIGDGKIFVLELDEAMRIRTGETGDNAL